VTSPEVSGCPTCGHTLDSGAARCPECRRWTAKAVNLRRRGWLSVILGLVLVGMMGTITYRLAPAFQEASDSSARSGFTGTPSQGTLILGLFGLIIIFALAGLVNGLWQIVTGRRNAWIMVLFFGVALLVIGVGAGVYWSLRGTGKAGAGALIRLPSP
jgi:hypothetical protein